MRARSLSAVATALSVAVVLAVFFGMNDRNWMLIVPVLAGAASTIWPVRTVVAIAMLVTAAVVVLGRDGSGVLFGASVVALMLALNNLQAAATRIGRGQRAPQQSRR